MPTPPAAFRDALAALPPERFAAFVDAVWTARGRSVTRTGSTLTVENGDGETVLYARAAGEDQVPDDADVVVSATPPERGSDQDWVGPAELRTLLRFAVPDPERERLAGEFLGVDPDDQPAVARDDVAGDRTESAPAGRQDDSAPGPVDAPDGASGTAPAPPGGDVEPDSETQDGRRRSTRRTVLLAGGAFVAGLGTAAAGGLGPFGSAGGEQSDAPTTPTPEPSVAVPGLSRSGVADPQVLARAHLDRLEATSFTITSTRTVHAGDGTLLSSLRLSARVDESRQFVAEFGTAGPAGRDVFGDPPMRATLYSDGESQYRRLAGDDGISYNAVPLGAGVNGWFYWTNVFPFGGLFYASDEYYRDLLDAVPVSVTSRAGDGQPPYNLHATAVTVSDPNPQVFAALNDESSVGNLSLLASVTGAGLVDSLRLSYDGERLSDPVRAQVSTDYRDLGETTVDRPDWADRAESS